MESMIICVPAEGKSRKAPSPLSRRYKDHNIRRTCENIGPKSDGPAFGSSYSGILHTGMSANQDLLA